MYSRNRWKWRQQMTEEMEMEKENEKKNWIITNKRITSKNKHSVSPFSSNFTLFVTNVSDCAVCLFPVLRRLCYALWLKLGSFTNVFFCSLIQRLFFFYVFRFPVLKLAVMIAKNSTLFTKYTNKFVDSQNHKFNPLGICIFILFFFNQNNMQITVWTKIVLLKCDRCNSELNCKLCDIFWFFIQFLECTE